MLDFVFICGLDIFNLIIAVLETHDFHTVTLSTRPRRLWDKGEGITYELNVSKILRKSFKILENSKILKHSKRQILCPFVHSVWQKIRVYVHGQRLVLLCPQIRNTLVVAFVSQNHWLEIYTLVNAVCKKTIVYHP